MKRSYTLLGGLNFRGWLGRHKDLENVLMISLGISKILSREVVLNQGSDVPCCMNQMTQLVAQRMARWLLIRPYACALPTEGAFTLTAQVWKLISMVFRRCTSMRPNLIN
jgi:hypothetical protein